MNKPDFEQLKHNTAEIADLVLQIIVAVLDFIVHSIFLVLGFLVVLIVATGIGLLQMTFPGFVVGLITNLFYPALQANFEHLPSFGFLELWMLSTLILYFLRLIYYVVTHDSHSVRK